MKACYEKGLMILKANDNTIRIAPSLIIEDHLILKGLKILKEVIQGAASLDFLSPRAESCHYILQARTLPRFALEEI